MLSSPGNVQLSEDKYLKAAEVCDVGLKVNIKDVGKTKKT